MYVRCQKHLNSIFFQFMKLTVALYCCIIRFMHLASKHIIRVAVSNYSFLTAGNTILSMLCHFYEENSQFFKRDFNAYKNIQISHLLIKHSPNLWEEQGRQTLKVSAITHSLQHIDYQALCRKAYLCTDITFIWGLYLVGHIFNEILKTRKFEDNFLSFVTFWFVLLKWSPYVWYVLFRKLWWWNICLV